MLMASMAPLPATGEWRMIDPGAGVGSLTAALAARWLAETDLSTMSVVAYEIDPGYTGMIRLSADLEVVAQRLAEH